MRLQSFVNVRAKGVSVTGETLETLDAVALNAVASVFGGGFGLLDTGHELG